VLRITPNGTATWSLRYRAKGATGTCRLTLDRYPDLGLADARDLAEIKRGEIARGVDPVVARREQKGAQEAADARVRFREIAEEYLKDRISMKENRRKLGIMFNTELLPVLGERDHVLPICRRIEGAGRRARRATCSPTRAPCSITPRTRATSPARPSWACGEEG
jgi:Arm DNA-binding domain